MHVKYFYPVSQTYYLSWPKRPWPKCPFTSGSLPLDATRDGITSIRLRNCLHIETWNVRSLYQHGKMQIVMNECDRNRMDIVGL